MEIVQLLVGVKIKYTIEVGVRNVTKSKIMVMSEIVMWESKLCIRIRIQLVVKRNEANVTFSSIILIVKPKNRDLYRDLPVLRRCRELYSICSHSDPAVSTPGRFRP